MIKTTPPNLRNVRECCYTCKCGTTLDNPYRYLHCKRHDTILLHHAKICDDYEMDSYFVNHVE